MAEKKKFDQFDYQNNYNKEKYDRINLNLPAGTKAELDKHIRKKGYTNYSKYIYDLIKEDMQP